MGKQIRFYAEESIEDNFVEYIYSNNAVLIDSRYVDTSPDIISTYQQYKDRKFINSIHDAVIYRRDFGELVTMGCAEKMRIDKSLSPVIEFSETTMQKNQRTGRNMIHHGRLWLEMRYYDRDDNIVTKGKELNNFYKLCAGWIKKHIPYREIWRSEGHRITGEPYENIAKDHISDKMLELKVQELKDYYASQEEYIQTIMQNFSKNRHREESKSWQDADEQNQQQHCDTGDQSR